MKYGDFLNLLMTYKKLREDFGELYEMGFDFMEGRYLLEGNVSKLFDSTLNLSFTEKGVDWINWFIYENDWGTTDWSGMKVLDAQGKLTDRDPMDSYGARDEDGNPICYSFESTWDVVKNHLK